MDNTCYMLGSFQLSPTKRTLSLHGEALTVPDKVLDFLLMLCEADGELVSKDDMYDALWPKQVVTEASLSRLVSDTRAILAKGDPNTDFIQTVRGKGFRLSPTLSMAVEEPMDTAKVNKQPWLIAFLASTTLIFIAGFFWVWVSKSQDRNVFQGGGTIVILPVNVATGDDQDNWVEYGVMTMLAKQLESYPRLSVIDTGSTLKNLSTINFDHSIPSSEKFATVCEPLGCDTLIVSELMLENGSPVLQYQIYTERLVSAQYKFPNANVLEASKLLIEHALMELAPQESERIELKDFYISDPAANQEFALGVSALYHSDYKLAQNYLSSVTERYPNFFWAKAYLTDSMYRTGEYEQAEAYIFALQNAADLQQNQKVFLGNMQSNLLYAQGKLEESQKISLELLPVVKKLEDQEGIGNILMNIGTSYTALGNSQAAEDYLRQAVEQYQSHNFRLREAQALFNLGNAIYIESPLSTSAQENYREASILFRQFGARGFLAFTLLAQAEYKRKINRFEDARSLLAEASELYRATGDEEGELLVEVDLANVEISDNNYDQAIAHLLKAFERAGDQYTYVRSHSAAILSIVYLNIGLPEKVPALLVEQAKYDWFDPRTPQVMLKASLAHREGNYKQALEEAQAIKDKLGEQWTPSHQQFLDAFTRSANSERAVEMDYDQGILLEPETLQ